MRPKNTPTKFQQIAFPGLRLRLQPGTGRSPRRAVLRRQNQEPANQGALHRIRGGNNHGNSPNQGQLCQPPLGPHSPLNLLPPPHHVRVCLLRASSQEQAPYRGIPQSEPKHF